VTKASRHKKQSVFSRDNKKEKNGFIRKVTKCRRNEIISPCGAVDNVGEDFVKKFRQ
jgi:hypothetical protein